jgi:NAD(P)-dependent dehydrogenase (short-subunit alcohol dehydrogenase family)
MSEPRVWLITGTSVGLGRALVEAVAASGDQVIATARRPETLNDLVVRFPGNIWAARLDVTDQTAIAPLITEMTARFGRIDVLVNNAGHGHLGAVEQTSDAALRELFELHVFGPAALVRAVLPGMRKRRSGTIVQVSSLAAHVVFPGLSGYCASKAALEGLSEALASEVRDLGIRVLIAEPGGLRTEFCGDGLKASTPLPDYQATVGQLQQMMKTAHGKQLGDPVRAAQAILTALAAEKLPLRLPLGDDAVDMMGAQLDAMIAELRAGEKLSRSINFVETSSAGS